MIAPASFNLHLQLAPSRTTRPDLNQVIEEAFTSAALPFEWRVMRGDPTGDDVPIAAPSLEVVVSTLDQTDPLDLVGSIRADLGAALRTIRRNAPDLPLGILSLTGEGSVRLAFRPEAAPSDIVEALWCLHGGSAASGVLGWDERLSTWVTL